MALLLLTIMMLSGAAMLFYLCRSIRDVLECIIYPQTSAGAYVIDYRAISRRSTQAHCTLYTLYYTDGSEKIIQGNI